MEHTVALLLEILVGSLVGYSVASLIPARRRRKSPPLLVTSRMSDMTETSRQKLEADLKARGFDPIMVLMMPNSEGHFHTQWLIENK